MLPNGPKVKPTLNRSSEAKKKQKKKKKKKEWKKAQV